LREGLPEDLLRIPELLQYSKQLRFARQLQAGGVEVMVQEDIEGGIHKLAPASKILSRKCLAHLLAWRHFIRYFPRPNQSFFLTGLTFVLKMRQPQLAEWFDS
jgi:hypothetical protein